MRPDRTLEPPGRSDDRPGADRPQGSPSPPAPIARDVPPSRQPIRASDVDELRRRVSGRLVVPADADYDDARGVWNALADRRPGAILRPQATGDVVAAVREAAERDWLLAVRGGGHSVAGHGVCEGGLVIDLAEIRNVDVDPRRGLATVGGGSLWGDLDAATAEHGLATTGGQISTTGVGGLTLGGGVGWLMREHGLSVDNLLSAEVITADARIRHVTRDEEPDLFWAIRGGGGNFGIVTSFTFSLHPTATVSAGVLIHPVDEASDMIRHFADNSSTFPRAMTVMVLLLAGPRQPFVPERLQGQPVAAFAVCHTGTEAEADRDIRRLREFGRPVGDSIRRRPYVELQRLFDQGSRPGLRNRWRGQFLAALPSSAAETIAQLAETMTSPDSQVLLTHMEGAVADVAPDATPFRFRAAPYYLEILSKWRNPDEDAIHTEWAEASHSRMEPFSAGGTYVNFLDDASESDVAAAYGPDIFHRLADLKLRYDPDNLFRVNHNVRPAVRT